METHTIKSKCCICGEELLASLELYEERSIGEFINQTLKFMGKETKDYQLKLRGTFIKILQDDENHLYVVCSKCQKEFKNNKDEMVERIKWGKLSKFNNGKHNFHYIK